MKSVIVVSIILGSVFAQAADITCVYQALNKDSSKSVEPVQKELKLEEGSAVMFEKAGGYSFFAACEKTGCELSITDDKTNTQLKTEGLFSGKSKMVFVEMIRKGQQHVGISCNKN